MNNFLVYRSSAGSGKTYTLIRVYLEIVLKEPARFRNILAITFTNKAANEIKQRVLLNLKLLSRLDYTQIPEKNRHLVASLLASTGLDHKTLKERANTVLSMILHAYADFAVSTIDSFMHRIIRSFSFDLKLSMNFDVEMNTDLLQAEAADVLISKAGQDQFITGVLVEFIRERAENDESWQIERDLQRFSAQLFNEEIVDVLPVLNDFTKDKLEAVNLKLTGFIREFEEAGLMLGRSAAELISGNNLDAALFANGSRGIYGYFIKLAEGRITAAEDPNSYAEKTIATNEWLSAKGKNSPDRNRVLQISGELGDLYTRIRSLSETGASNYLLYKNIRANLYPMALLGELSRVLEGVKQERNIVSIAEFNRIIASIVANEPVPFIYERTGEKFRHYLIDEFQDTSVLQWLNLLPLLENSLSHAGKNMIVGDGKQAIYRFRNGEVDQFIRLPEVDNPRGNELLNQRSAVLKREYFPDSLDSNFRSKAEVVDFNNRFFEFASGRFIPGLENVYAGIQQQFRPENTGGLVHIEFHDENLNDFNDFNCSGVLRLIREVTASGYQAGDITVLCRSNRNASAIASFLNDKGVRVVSSESLLLRNSPEVNFLVSFISVLNDPLDRIGRVAIINYLLSEPETSGDGRHTCFDEAQDARFYILLKQLGYPVSAADLQGLSLYDACEQLIRIFGLHEKSPVYMRFFLDEVLKYTAGKNSGTAGFLEYWEQFSPKLSVVLPRSSDAVQIMTIHKSKGLEFPVVIYAFANDDFKRLTRKTAWIKLNDETLPGLQAALLKIDKTLEKTQFSDIYAAEYNKTRLDLLNLIYVAFTRAAERLYILTGKPSEKSGELKSVSALMKEYLSSTAVYSDGQLTYTFGDETAGNVERPHTETAPVMQNDFITTDWRSRLVFAGRAPKVWQAGSPSGGQKAGILVHLALSMIRVSGELDQACSALVNQGVITAGELPDIREKLKSILSHPDAVSFFDGSGNAATEMEILTTGGKSFRPDRVVFYPDHTDLIDYKTGKPLESHAVQVRHYASLLRQMGYPEVKAWLIYLETPLRVIQVP